MVSKEMKEFLDEKVEEYNRPFFIENDPISIPHQYHKKQDIEITGLWAAVLAWGQRKTIINKCRELFQMMDNQPYEFIMNHSENELKLFQNFRHRTFNAIDTLYFIHFLRQYYSKNESLEQAFIGTEGKSHAIENGLIQFRKQFFDLPDSPLRTRKHIPTPEKNSACKRLNMFLRWMVRIDSKGVDFGIWNDLKPADLVCPCDLHVDRVARKLGLIHRKQTDWQTALELTAKLKLLDPNDPVKYDFALFGLGVIEGFR